MLGSPATDERRRAGRLQARHEGPGRAFFAAQRFLMRDNDVLYVSNAASVDLQKLFSVFTRWRWLNRPQPSALQERISN